MNKLIVILLINIVLNASGTNVDFYKNADGTPFKKSDFLGDYDYVPECHPEYIDESKNYMDENSDFNVTY